MIMKRCMLQIMLAALLLVAQHGALTHQIWHLQNRLPVQSQQHDGGKQKYSDSCDFHVAFAEILGAVNSVALPPRAVANTAERSSNHFPRAFPVNPVVPASRGPPVLS